MEYAPPNRLLRVDLTAQTVESEAIPAEWLRKYIGGKGLAARYLYEELPPEVAPLGSENVLLFMLGPLSGLTPGEQRYATVTKSPLTGTFLDSYAGGRFPETLVGALDGHLGVLVEGVADSPMVLEIADGEGTLRPADDLWGLETAETCEKLDGAVACIGPAGERQVRYATVASDAGDHQAGRGGAGAVLGAKRLKAVVASGEPPDALAELRAEYEQRFADDEAGRWQSASATLETLDFADEVGVLPTRGWQEGSFDGAPAIGIEAAREATVGRERPDDPVPGGFEVEGESTTVPRGATPISLGAGLGIDDFDAVTLLGERCDTLGMDVISAGNAVAWAIRAGEEGILDRDLSFGDPNGARDLLGEIAERESSLGDALAEGVAAAAGRFGGQNLVPTIKAMSLSSYDPRGSMSMALAYATSDRGACHRRARPVVSEVFATESWTNDRRARAVIEEQNVRSLLWSLVVDDFASEVFWDDLGAEWLDALGLSYDRSDLRAVGERTWTLTRLFNVREGFDRSDDALPASLAEPNEGDDDGALDPDAFQRLLSSYYRTREWDERGRPSATLLKRLDLSNVVDGRTPVGRLGH